MRATALAVLLAAVLAACAASGAHAGDDAASGAAVTVSVADPADVAHADGSNDVVAYADDNNDDDVAFAGDDDDDVSNAGDDDDARPPATLDAARQALEAGDTDAALAAAQAALAEDRVRVRVRGRGRGRRGRRLRRRLRRKGRRGGRKLRRRNRRKNRKRGRRGRKLRRKNRRKNRKRGRRGRKLRRKNRRKNRKRGRRGRKLRRKNRRKNRRRNRRNRRKNRKNRRKNRRRNRRKTRKARKSRRKARRVAPGPSRWGQRRVRPMRKTLGRRASQAVVFIASHFGAPSSSRGAPAYGRPFRKAPPSVTEELSKLYRMLKVGGPAVSGQPCLKSKATLKSVARQATCTALALGDVLGRSKCPRYHRCLERAFALEKMPLARGSSPHMSNQRTYGGEFAKTALLETRSGDTERRACWTCQIEKVRRDRAREMALKAQYATDPVKRARFKAMAQLYLKAADHSRAARLARRIGRCRVVAERPPCGKPRNLTPAEAIARRERLMGKLYKHSSRRIERAFKRDVKSAVDGRFARFEKYFVNHLIGHAHSATDPSVHPAPLPQVTGIGGAEVAPGTNHETDYDPEPSNFGWPKKAVSHDESGLPLVTSYVAGAPSKAPMIDH
jgi:hypothetical protein